MSICLRTRILQTHIRCLPWKRWKGEIELLPVSSKTLFSKSGLSTDLLEIDLREEGFLLGTQCLLEFLKDTDNLKSRKQGRNWKINHTDCCRIIGQKKTMGITKRRRRGFKK